jgi:VWFA-related protein
MRRFALVALLTFASTQDSSAQQAPKPPVFSASTSVVLVDFVVTDGKDRAVAGLTAQDFVVKEDGQPRPVVSFVAYADAPRAQGEVVVVPPGGAPPVSKAITVTVLFVDDAQISAQQLYRAKPALKKLVATMSDRGGVLALAAPRSKIWLARGVDGNAAVFNAALDRIEGRWIQDQSDFPITDAEAFAVERGNPWVEARIVQRFVALTPRFDPGSAAIAARSRALEVARAARLRREDAYNTITTAFDWLAQLPGRHSVIMVSGGFAEDPDDSRQQELVTRSLRANAPIHFLDARGLEAMGKLQGVDLSREPPARDAGELPFAFLDAAEGASSLSRDSGGITVQNANDLSKGLARVFDTMTTYYILGYEPPAHTRKGFRKIKVESAVKGLQILARAGYFDDVPSAR